MKTLILTFVFPLALFADSVQPSFNLLTPLTSGTIPTTAKGWTVSVLTGTATVGGVAYSSGMSIFDLKSIPSSPIVITTGTGSTAYYRFNQ